LERFRSAKVSPGRGRSIAGKLSAAAEKGTVMTITLSYVFDNEPGITRERGNGGFEYFYPDGRPVRSRAVIKRVNSLAIPPAYTDVWICRDPSGHIQATGRDAKGRKQYRYHPDWDILRNSTKYERMLAFGKALPEIRRRVAACLKQDGLPREKVLAAVVKLLVWPHHAARPACRGIGVQDPLRVSWQGRDQTPHRRRP
jgi:DNA topoisomerase-1